MPELPEAETIVRGLRRHLPGERVRRLDVVHADVLRRPRRAVATALRGRTIEQVERRGKNVLLPLDDNQVVAINLGMTGRLLPFPTPPRGRAAPTHPTVRLRFDSGALLVFDDVRRFGTFECLSAEEWRTRCERMGPEPLGEGYRAADLHAALTRSRSPVRSWLLDQRRIAGVGNIYANEALFLAGIHPARPARSVGPAEARRLHGALRGVLSAAIDARGTTLRDYRDAAGAEGSFAPALAVYGRAGEACARCGRTIRRIVFANRSAFHCPGCQPGRPARRLGG